MEQKNPTFRLRTNALILFALFYAAAAITALLGLLDFDLWAFKDMLLAMEIVTPSVVQGSYVFFGVIALVMVLWPGVLAVCIAMALFKRSGFSLLSGIVDVCAKAVKILRYVFKRTTNSRNVKFEYPTSSFAKKVKEEVLSGRVFHESLGVIMLDR